jgi:hypothetical protein
VFFEQPKSQCAQPYPSSSTGGVQEMIDGITSSTTFVKSEYMVVWQLKLKDCQKQLSWTMHLEKYIEDDGIRNKMMNVDFEA